MYFFRKLFFCIIIISLSLQLVAQENSEESGLRKASDRMRFDNALQFYNLKKYEEALKHFNEYLEVYYNGNYRSDAYRYIAEIYLQKFRYLDAIDIYDRMFREFSNDESGVNACYSKGICYLKMGYENQARDVFNYIMSSHPGTKAAVNSEIQIELLKLPIK